METIIKEMEDRPLLISDAAAILGVTPPTVKSYVELGLLTCELTPKGVRVFRESTVIEFKQQRAKKNSA